MLEAFSTVLTATYNVLKAVRDFKIVPSRENEERLNKHIAELEDAYNYFELQMTKVSDDLGKGITGNLNKDIEKYDSVLDKNITQIIGKVRQVLNDIKQLKRVDLTSIAKELAERGERILELWKEFLLAIRGNNVRDISRSFKWIGEAIKRYIQDTEALAEFAKRW